MCRGGGEVSVHSEVHDQVLCLLHVDAEVILSAPIVQVFHFLCVAKLIVSDASDHCCVIHEPRNITAWMPNHIP